MSWLNKIKGAIYEDGGEESSAPQAAPTGLGAGIPSSNSAAPIQSGINQDMVAAIKKATFGRNTAFTQLLAAAEALADVIPDATMRLKAAHKTAGAGRTGRQIADAVDVHLQDVDGEEMRFKAVLDGKASTEIAGIEAQAQLATQQIQSAQEQIAAAQARIVELNTSIGNLSQTAAQATTAAAQKRAELDQAMNQFKLAAQAVRNELNGNKAAIVSTLT